MDASYDEISRALQTYFDGFYDGDIETLKGIFHPACHLYSATDGPLLDDDMEAVYARVAGRTTGASQNEVRRDRILSIDKSGPESALVKVQIAIGPKLFTDYLNLLKIDGQWRIIAKIYTYVLLAEAQAQAAE
ncbi:MAG: nuclear transport factor 2 family protein [Alphaproteobacteria bacterium]|jgi:4-oxalocrotonate tautomerase|nr:nuclear transport factor 2 family protein [Alphaproteobacteria bacterium]MDP6815196.1 nuclear transport factor 2 family protein [Alphaproteobacteria bacterium]